MMTILLFVAGLALLVVGGELLVRGASSLATAIGISPLVVGLTVVALGTSAPELAVSVRASLAGQGDIAAGNVIGSNIFNVLFILGLSALIRPLAVSAQLVRLDVPIMIVAAGLMWAMCQDGTVSRLDGVVLVGCIVAYTTFLIVQSRRETRAFQQAVLAQVEAKRVVDDTAAKADAPRDQAKRSSVPLQLILIVVGLVGLVFGARFLVDAAVQVASSLGVSELVIGLTIVSAGTSLPEVAASVIATARGQRDIAVGNVIGSNIFNTLCILGAAAVARPVPVPQSALHFDLPVMVAVTLACLPVFIRGRVIARWEGLLFVAYYAAYTAYLILKAAQYEALPRYSRVVFWYVIPITAATLVALALGDLRPRRRSAQFRPAGGEPRP
jgi:cation:H+ antiporter